MKGGKKTIQTISSEIAVRLFERQGKNNTILSTKKGGKGRVRIKEESKRGTGVKEVVKGEER